MASNMGPHGGIDLNSSTASPIMSNAAGGSATPISGMYPTQMSSTPVVPMNTDVTMADQHNDTKPAPVMLLNKARLQELVAEIDPDEQLDDDVEENLLQLADEFIENVVSHSCQLAKHRKSASLEVKDVQMVLERQWNMYVPGFGRATEIKQYPKSASTEAHKQRLALIKKTLKK